MNPLADVVLSSVYLENVKFNFHRKILTILILHSFGQGNSFSQFERVKRI